MSPTTPPASEGFWYAEVVRTRRLSSHLIRIAFGGEGLAGFASTGSPDESLAVIFPRPGEERPPLPVLLEDGGWEYPRGEAPSRVYSVRRHDPVSGELEIEFVLHPGGVAGAWAEKARPGDIVGVSAPYARYRAPARVRRLQLFGDLTAVPAIGRILEQLPPEQQAEVWIEAPSAADVFAITHSPAATVHWELAPRVTGRSRLPQLVAEHADDAESAYLWMAGEAGSAREVRRHLRRERGWPNGRCATFGYWRTDREEWLRRYERVRPELDAALDALRAAGLSEEELVERFDAALDARGL